MTDDLDKRIRAARPTSGNRDLPLTDRAKRELAELMLEGDRRQVPRRRRIPTALVVAVALVILVPFGIYGVMALVSSSGPSSVSVAEVAADQPNGDQATHQAWASLIDAFQEQSVAATETATDASAAPINVNVLLPGSAVTEQWSFSQSPDGVSKLTITAPNSTTDGPLRFSDPAPVALEDYPFFLAAEDAASAIDSLQQLLLEQTLDRWQLDALYRYLATLPDLQLTASTEDSLVFSTTSAQQRTLSIAKDGSAVLAIEGAASSYFPPGTQITWTSQVEEDDS